MECNSSLSNIQGNVSRAEELGDLTLTDTFYSRGLRLDTHAHQRACFGFVLAGGFFEQFPVGNLSCGGRAVFFRPPELVHEDRVSREGLACEMAAQFCCSVGVIRRASSPPRWLRHINEILRCHFKESLRGRGIFREVGMHLARAAREFRRYYGTTIGQFRLQCRMDSAPRRPGSLEGTVR